MLLPLSTIAAEAVIFEKPIILVNIVDNDDSKFDPNFQFLLKNNLAESTSINNLISTLNFVMSKKTYTRDPSMRENFLNRFFNFDKKCDYVSEIQNLVKTKN